MTTRVEIDGFESFLDFELDVPPFLVLVGPNSSGESNFFDAIEYSVDSLRLGREALLRARRRRPQSGRRRLADYSDHIGQNIDLEALAQVPAYAARAAETEEALKGLGYL